MRVRLANLEIKLLTRKICSFPSKCLDAIDAVARAKSTIRQTVASIRRIEFCLFMLDAGGLNFDHTQKKM